IVFNTIKKSRTRRFAEAFSYRLFDKGSAIVLSTAELATIAHLPRPDAALAAPDVRQEHSSAAPASSGIPRDGLLLGNNDFRGTKTPIYLSAPDRLRHLYTVGQTGTGKSTFLKNLILQDIKNGEGVCFIDPHGSDIFDIIGSVPPERIDDVIYFDPGDLQRPLALNMLEYDANHPEQKTLVVDELLGIFNKLYDMKTVGGPAFEQYFRNAALLVMESPELGSTLLDIARLFSDDAYRAQKIAACRNPIVVKFWEDIAERTTGEQGLQNYAPYITNKFDVFTTNEIMRPIIAQQKSSMNFREIMDKKKILLVNLAKGRIGDINGNLLGLIIVGKFLLAALSRADSPGRDLPPFYLYIDEFQNFSTPSIATILSEARKYKLSLTVAHQFVAQLSEEIRDAVFGNVGNLVAFRVGAQDAEFLEKQFVPTFTQADLLRIDNYNAFARILARGEPQPPFNISIPPFPGGSTENALRLAQISALLYGRPRKEIEAEIAKRYKE
ncbi:MAG: type IV secretory system conjugative DNA transfer family protein, partial [Minisyncoccia bacterium]